MWSSQQIEAVFRELFVPRADSPLRPEERRKVPELAALLPEIERTGARSLVDAAAGRAPLGLVAAKLLDLDELWILEREPARAERARILGGSLRTRVEVRVGGVEDHDIWPERPELVVGLHACGPASDHILDACLRTRPRHLLLVPCCYADKVPFTEAARAHLDALGVPSQAGLRRRLIEGLVDAERALRLEAAGYEVDVLDFVPSSVTPHNKLLRARWFGPSRGRDQAGERLRRLRTPSA